jgi:uncharacterized protein YodC (DUF2158 family)
MQCMEERPRLLEGGDKVRLKTGGPIMTVQVAPDHMAYCVWFVGDKPHHGTFHQDALDLVAPKGSFPDSVYTPLA